CSRRLVVSRSLHSFPTRRSSDLVPWIALKWGWQWAFIATGSLGFVWLFLWLAMYRSPESNPRVSRDELAHIRSDPPDPENARVRSEEHTPELQSLRHLVCRLLLE